MNRKKGIALPIQFATPDVGKAEMKEIEKVLKSGWLTNGPVVRKFEREVARLSYCNRAVAYDSCTAAMEMTLRALGIGPGDEVITTPYTYAATADVIRNVGAKIVFVDLAEFSFEMDYQKMADAITERTKAIMPVDIGGALCNYETIYQAIDCKADIFKPSNPLQEAIGRPAVIADAAHSFTACKSAPAFSSRRVLWSGEFADFTCFSFHVLKNLTTGGEGGAVVWNDIPGYDNDVLERKLRLLGDHGQTSRDKSKGWEYDIECFGFNHIMTNVDAAMGLAQIERLPELTKKRFRVTKNYDRLMLDRDIVPMLVHSVYTPEYISRSAFHLYPVWIPKGNYNDDTVRNAVFWRMKEAGIPCNVHYKPLPMMTAFKDAGYDIADYPNAYEMFRSVLTIPYHTMLTEDEQTYVADTLIRSIKQEVRKLPFIDIHGGRVL